jgi:hypothetical protein
MVEVQKTESYTDRWKEVPQRGLWFRSQGRKVEETNYAKCCEDIRFEKHLLNGAQLVGHLGKS